MVKASMHHQVTRRRAQGGEGGVGTVVLSLGASLAASHTHQRGSGPVQDARGGGQAVFLHAVLCRPFHQANVTCYIVYCVPNCVTVLPATFALPCIVALLHRLLHLFSVNNGSLYIVQNPVLVYITFCKLQLISVSVLVNQTITTCRCSLDIG